jgi:hypothetical protein
MVDHFEELKKKARQNKIEHYSKKAEAVRKLIKDGEIYTKAGCKKCW